MVSMEVVKKHAPSHIGTNLVTLLASYFLFLSTMSGNENELLKTAFAQIEKQSQEIVELREMLLESQLKIVGLETQVRENINRTTLLNEYLNLLPFPAWIKTYNETSGDFRMYLLNDSYTSEYGYTRGEYIGKTDFDIHPEAEAQAYRENDLAVISTGKSIREQETVETKAGRRFDIITYKFPIIVSGQRRGVGGVAIRGDFVTFDLEAETKRLEAGSG